MRTDVTVTLRIAARVPCSAAPAVAVVPAVPLVPLVPVPVVVPPAVVLAVVSRFARPAFIVPVTSILCPTCGFRSTSAAGLNITVVGMRRVCSLGPVVPAVEPAVLPVVPAVVSSGLRAPCSWTSVSMNVPAVSPALRQPIAVTGRGPRCALSGGFWAEEAVLVDCAASATAKLAARQAAVIARFMSLILLLGLLVSHRRCVQGLHQAIQSPRAARLAETREFD